MKYQQSFRQLIVWQKAKELTLNIYSDMKSFPRDELYSLCSQLKRASYSVMANIAEGNNRKTKKDKQKFLNIALASLTELDCLLELSMDLHYIKRDQYEQRLADINKTAFLLRKLSSAIENPKSPSQSSPSS